MTNVVMQSGQFRFLGNLVPRALFRGFPPKPGKSALGTRLVSVKLPIYSSPKPALSLTSHIGQNVGLGEGLVGGFPKT